MKDFITALMLIAAIITALAALLAVVEFAARRRERNK